MKNYKEYEKRIMGSTDIATIRIFTNNDFYEIATGMDGTFSAYWIEGDAEIGSHYKLLKTFENTTYIVIGDETFINITEEWTDGVAYSPKIVKIYNSGYHGYIIQVLDGE